MTPLPESPYCRVRARVATIWADGPDEGTHPDWRPAVGERVTLTPSIGEQLLVFDVAGPAPIIVTVERVQCEVDADGWLVHADGRPVFIAPTDDPTLSATGWTWTAVIKGKQVVFSAPTGGVVDLALFIATPAVEAVEYVSVVQIVADYLTANPPDVATSVADWLTANPPSSPDATALTKGIVRLAGDLGGTADAPSVPGLSDKADADHTHTLVDITDYTAPPPPPDLSGYATTSAVASALAGKADARHGHAISDVSGLQSALDGKQVAGSYAPALGADDNYVTAAEKVKLGNLSGTNTGDQTLPTWSTIAGKPAAVAAGADAAAARAAIGAGTSDLTLGTTASTAKAGNYSPPAASETTQGIVELATIAETTTGTDTTRAVTPAGVKALADTKADASHTHGVTNLTATGTRDATTYLRGDNTWATPAGGGGGVTDHGALNGLGDDDHPQYHTDARGDARYVGLTDPRLSNARTPTAHTHDDLYYTESEVDAALAGKASSTHNHEGVYATANHNHDGVYAQALGDDDNYVTDAEKAALHSHANKTALDAVSGTNTGDQDLSGLATTTALTNGLATKADTSHTHTAAQVSDATTTGRSVLTAANSTAARTAIGAGTSNLTIGTTGTTAAAGNRAATEAAIGMVELATTAEATTGTDTTRAVTPAGVKAVADTKAPVSHTHAYADLTGKPTLGTAAATASTDYASAAQGAKADTALQPATGQAINTQTETAYTLAASDAGKLVTLTNAAAITLTVPGNVFTAGQRVDCIVAGAGMVTAVGSSCTVNGTPSRVSRAQWSAFTVLFTSATTAVVVGDLGAA